MLKHRVDVALVWRHTLHVFTRDTNEPSIGLFEPSEHAQCGGLATATRAEQRQKLAGVHFEIDFVNGNDVAVTLGYIDEFNGAALNTHCWLSPPLMRNASHQMLMLAITCLTRV